MEPCKQAVIAAAGKGSRMGAFKPLVELRGRPLIDHVGDALPSEVEEVIMIIGHSGHLLQNYCGNTFHGRSVRYVEQTELNGPAKALWLAEPFIEDRFILLFCDDKHRKFDMERLVRYQHALAVAFSETPERFGVVETDDHDMVIDIVEKPEKPKSHWVSTGPIVHDRGLFEFEPNAPVVKDGKSEYFLPEVLVRSLQKYPLRAIEEQGWLAANTPGELRYAEGRLGESS